MLAESTRKNDMNDSRKWVFTPATGQARYENPTTIRGYSMKAWLGQVFFVLLYLAAIVAANLLVAWLGPGATIANAFLFIGLDLTARDRLHEAWHKSGLVWKMGLLIATGSILSWLLNHSAGQIALASFVAFALAAITDTIAYSLAMRRGWSWMRRSNGSNLASAAVDSLVFPTLAFGSIMPWVTLGQFAAKVFGGALWSVILSRRGSGAL